MASIFIRTLIIYVFISISLKVMGKRQLGELEVGELVSTLLVSEVAALPIADPDIPLMNAVIPILFIVCLEIIVSSIKNKSEKLKKYIEGKPIFLIYKGELKQSALSENRISINELLCEIRMQGVGNISDVYYAVLEQNGKLSIFEKDKNKSFTHTLIVDTETNEKVLSRLGYDEKWLQKQLDKHKVDKKDVFLMTIDDNEKTYIIKKEEIREDN